MKRAILAAVISATSFISGAHANETLDMATKIGLQAAMQREIQEKTVDGRFYYIDRTAAKLAAIYPSKSHPMILKMGDKFVLCTDFLDDAGQSVNVDFYLAPSAESFVVFDTIVADHSALQTLLQSGAIVAAN